VRRGLWHVLAALTTLPALYACSTAQQASFQAKAATAIQAAQVVCVALRGDGPVIVALADAAGAPVLATAGVDTARQVACAAIGAIPAPMGAVPEATVLLPLKPG
jgi:hypothetical protein